MSNLDYIAALPKLSAAVKALLRQAMTLRAPYSLAPAENLQTIDVVDPDYGTVPLFVMQNGRVFAYDAADSTTLHDGTTCLVSHDNKRFKVDDFRAPFSVLSKSLTAPPGSPALGDNYIVGTASTGAWAGKDGQIAQYTSRGWLFVISPIGRLIYVQDETAFYHRNVSGTWTRGVGSLPFSANSVAASALVGKPIRWIVINATTNAPPGSPSVGDAYIIGSAPTGAWAGNAAKIAICESGSTFTIYSPRDGELAYDQAVGKDKRYSSATSSWIAGADAMVLISTQLASASSSIDFTTGLDDTYDCYELRLSGVKPGTDAVQPFLRIATGSPATWQTTGYEYFYASQNYTGGSNTGETNTSAIKLGPSSVAGNAAGKNLNGIIRFNNPEVSDYCQFWFEMQMVAATGGPPPLTTGARGGGHYSTAAAITGLRILMSSGTIAAGRFSLYGIRKS